VNRYAVIVTPEAQSNIREAFLYINDRSPLNGQRWLRNLYKQIDKLEQFPERCPYARERSYLGTELRQLLFKSHRIIFLVDKPKHSVYVLHVRHGKRRAVARPRILTNSAEGAAYSLRLAPVPRAPQNGKSAAAHPQTAKEPSSFTTLKKIPRISLPQPSQPLTAPPDAPNPPS
jgi:plasmid stabilization system protein ParE